MKITKSNNANNLIISENFMKFKESFIDYLDVDDLTLRAYKCGIDKFIEYMKDNKIKQPTRDDIIAFRNYLRENYSTNTTNSYMVAIKSLFRYLEIHGMYENIAVDIKGAKYTNIPKKQVLSLDKAKEIYSKLTNIEEKCMFSLMITTGLRTCEVASADIEDIQMLNGEIVLFILGKKRDDKSEYVKLSYQVLEDIKNYIGNRTSGSIFVSTSNNSNGSRLSTTSIRSKIKNIFKRFGLEEDTFSCHSLRRSCATIMYQNGVDVHSIQQILHHLNLNTTMRYINQITRDDNKGEQIVSNLIFN